MDSEFGQDHSNNSDKDVNDTGDNDDDVDDDDADDCDDEDDVDDDNDNDLDHLITASRLANGKRTTKRHPSTIDKQRAHIAELRSRNAYATLSAPVSYSPPALATTTPTSTSILSAMQSPNVNSPAIAAQTSVHSEKCPHCPFETDRTETLSAHMQHHRCVVSASPDRQHRCEHCDYAASDARTLRRHVRLHFAGFEADVDDADDQPGAEESADEENSTTKCTRRLRSARSMVKYFTSYDGLVLSSNSSSSCSSSNNSAGDKSSASSSTGRTRQRTASTAQSRNLREAVGGDAGASGEIIIFPVPLAASHCNVNGTANGKEENSSDKENNNCRIIVDIRTGEVLSA